MGWSNQDFLFRKDFDQDYLLIHEELGRAILDKVDETVKIYLFQILIFFHDFFYSSYILEIYFYTFKLGREVQPNLFKDGHLFRK